MSLGDNMSHVEPYNPTLPYSYYVIEENGAKRIQIHLHESKRQLTGFNEQLTIQQLFRDLFPDAYASTHHRGLRTVMFHTLED